MILCRFSYNDMFTLFIYFHNSLFSDDFMLLLNEQNQSFVTRTEVLRAIKQAEKIVEQKKNEAKTDQEKRRKSERIISLCNQRVRKVSFDNKEGNWRCELFRRSSIFCFRQIK